MSEFEPPPTELSDLFAAEKVAPTVDASTRAALRSRLAATVGHAPLGHAAAGTALGGAGKTLATIALVLAAGAGTVIAVRHASSSGPIAAQTAPSSPNVVVVGAPDPEPSAELRIPKMENASPPIEEPARAVDAPRTLAPHRAVVPSEPELLKRAWTALSDGEPQKALQITEQDAQLHPDGDLAEEREAARIAALAKLHRIDEARSAASRFLQVHPASVHRALVERAIHSEEMP